MKKETSPKQSPGPSTLDRHIPPPSTDPSLTEPAFVRRGIQDHQIRVRDAYNSDVHPSQQGEKSFIYAAVVCLQVTTFVLGWVFVQIIESLIPNEVSPSHPSPHLGRIVSKYGVIPPQAGPREGFLLRRRSGGGHAEKFSAREAVQHPWEAVGGGAGGDRDSPGGWRRESCRPCRRCPADELSPTLDEDAQLVAQVALSEDLVLQGTGGGYIYELDLDVGDLIEWG